MSEVILLPVGFIVSLFCSMVGLGGGSFIMPTLLWLGLHARTAIGTSIFAVMVTSLSATMLYALQRRVNYRAGLLLGSLYIPGAIVGACLTTVLASSLLVKMFGLYLMCVSAYLWVRKTEGVSSVALNRKFIVILLLGSFLSGIVSGLFGVGGGIISMPLMMLVLGMHIKFSAPTAMLGMSLTTICGFLMHFRLGHFSPQHATMLAPGCCLGAPIGIMFSSHMKGRTLQRILASLIFLIGIGLMFK